MITEAVGGTSPVVVVLTPSHRPATGLSNWSEKTIEVRTRN